LDEIFFVDLTFFFRASLLAGSLNGSPLEDLFQSFDAEKVGVEAAPKKKFAISKKIFTFRVTKKRSFFWHTQFFFTTICKQATTMKGSFVFKVLLSCKT
jgi:hypothetical protein